MPSFFSKILSWLPCHGGSSTEDETATASFRWSLNLASLLKWPPANLIESTANPLHKASVCSFFMSVSSGPVGSRFDCTSIDCTLKWSELTIFCHFERLSRSEDLAIIRELGYRILIDFVDVAVYAQVLFSEFSAWFSRRTDSPWRSMAKLRTWGVQDSGPDAAGRQELERNSLKTFENNVKNTSNWMLDGSAKPWLAMVVVAPSSFRHRVAWNARIC